jgi:hypothetical protein
VIDRLRRAASFCGQNDPASALALLDGLWVDA